MISPFPSTNCVSLQLPISFCSSHSSISFILVLFLRFIICSHFLSNHPFVYRFLGSPNILFGYLFHYCFDLYPFFFCFFFVFLVFVISNSECFDVFVSCFFFQVDLFPPFIFVTLAYFSCFISAITSIWLLALSTTQQLFTSHPFYKFSFNQNFFTIGDIHVSLCIFFYDPVQCKLFSNANSVTLFLLSLLTCLLLLPYITFFSGIHAIPYF